MDHLRVSAETPGVQRLASAFFWPLDQFPSKRTRGGPLASRNTFHGPGGWKKNSQAPRRLSPVWPATKVEIAWKSEEIPMELAAFPRKPLPKPPRHAPRPRCPSRVPCGKCPDHSVHWCRTTTPGGQY